MKDPVIYCELKSELYVISGQFKNPKEVAQKFLDTEGAHLDCGEVFWVSWADKFKLDCNIFIDIIENKKKKWWRNIDVLNQKNIQIWYEKNKEIIKKVEDSFNDFHKLKFNSPRIKFIVDFNELENKWIAKIANPLGDEHE